jgi:hypothetical protein
MPPWQNERYTRDPEHMTNEDLMGYVQRDGSGYFLVVSPRVV